MVVYFALNGILHSTTNAKPVALNSRLQEGDYIDPWHHEG
jgi:hypothetical protein